MDWVTVKLSPACTMTTVKFRTYNDEGEVVYITHSFNPGDEFQIASEGWDDLKDLKETMNSKNIRAKTLLSSGQEYETQEVKSGCKSCNKMRTSVNYIFNKFLLIG